MYNIYLISTDTFEATKLLKTDVSIYDVADIEMSEQKRYNPIEFYVAGFEIGSSEDLRHAKNL